MDFSSKTQQQLRASRFSDRFKGMPVLVTGHSGFTGGWLSLWLKSLGADITGLSLKPATKPNLYASLAPDTFTCSDFSNINDYADVKRVVDDAAPQVIFHLAAQPLVSRAYENPLESFSTNIMGTAHVLEAARQNPAVKAVICVTTDKVYADQNWAWGYRETDSLGGKDPYSASKSGAEMVALAYQATLAARTNNVAIATARGGNIIGGGDWSSNRIVPDFVRAHQTHSPLTLRRPKAVRPWQHVIALCHGYLCLADYLLEKGESSAENFNFGPRDDETKTVGELVSALAAYWPGAEVAYEKGNFVETEILRVDSAKARQILGWNPPIGFDQTVEWTAKWYQQFYGAPQNASEICLEQIAQYSAALS